MWHGQRRGEERGESLSTFRVHQLAIFETDVQGQKTAKYFLRKVTLLQTNLTYSFLIMTILLGHGVAGVRRIVALI
jgi:hypothetical protein